MQTRHILNSTFSELHWTHLGLVDDQTHDCGHQFGAAHRTLPVPVRFLQTRQRVRVSQRRHDVINPADSLGFSGGSSLSRPGENKCGQSPSVRLFSLFMNAPPTLKQRAAFTSSRKIPTQIRQIRLGVSPSYPQSFHPIHPSRHLQCIWNPPGDTFKHIWDILVQEHCGL